MNKEKQNLDKGIVEGGVPKLRFPEFGNSKRWQKKPFSKLFKIGSGRDYKHLEKGNIPVYGTGGYMLSVNDYLYDGKSACIGRKGTINKPMFLSGKFWTVDTLFYTHSFKDCTPEFIYLLFQNINWLNYNEAGGVPSLSKIIINKIEIYLPELKEQQKIANCLSSLDNLITAETEKLDHLKNHKKGLLQQLFPANGETKPQFRFPEFKNNGEWEITTLEKCLDYLQPTPYLVGSTDYEDKFEIPVLTAGKTFILGYTDEKEGVFNKNLPVIIFDDFTTATKFVNFPFKVKSSAVKILITKGSISTQFLFETIQNLKFEVSAHKRHWISVYSKLPILIPKDPKEQQKIADCFSSADDLIEAQKIKIKALKKHKKGLMQQLFPEPSRGVFSKLNEK